MRRRFHTWSVRTEVFPVVIGEDGGVSYDVSGLSGRPVVVSLSGPGVSVRRLSDGDPVRRRILNNPDLYWTVSDGAVRFVRKEVLSEFLPDAEASGMAIYSVVVGSVDDAPRIPLAEVARDDRLRNAVAGFWYRKFKLPLLLVFLLLLLGNFFLGQYLNGRLSLRQAAAETARRQEIRQAALTDRQRTVTARFTCVPDLSLTILCDRVAAMLPANARLTAMEASAQGVMLKGKAKGAETVSDLSVRLTAPGVFRRVDILSLAQDCSGEGCLFEIRAVL